jgi:hypothetical protein
MEILTPTEACLESSSDLTIATTEDIDIEHVHVFARLCSPTNPIGSSCEMCALDVRSPRKYHVDNTRRKVCDGASCAFHWAVRLCRASGTWMDVHLCGGETADAA